MKSNLEGQTMGRKGLETRTRLLDAANELLQSTPLREIRTADLARNAGISPASFYLYFENVEAVVLALAERVADQASPLIELAEMPWGWADADDNVEKFVRIYFDFWDRHRPILRVRNLAAEEGSWSFLNARMRVTAPLHQAICAKIDAGRKAAKAAGGTHSLSLATVALAGLERSAATYPTYPIKYAVTRERLIDASIYMLKTIVLGTEPLANQ